uniref:Cation/H+ exchanger domain-containing protein n=1 Tax=Panagrolaimus sp. PS1159 TaxID=55785 RepID=A0AC35FNV5_9BILA
MDAQIRERFKENFKIVMKHRQANLILTSIIGFIAIYITLVAIFQRNLFHPLAITNVTDFDERPFDQTEILDYTDPMVFQPRTFLGVDVPYEEDYILTIISLFVLWVCAVTLGKLGSYLFLPPLLGMLIVGILFGNIPSLSDMIHINRTWEDTLRQFAFICILIRAGISLDPEILRNSLYMCSMLGIGSTLVEVVIITLASYFFFGYMCSMLGIGSTLVEVIIITLASYFFFGVPLAISIAFGFILASTSPAVTVPAMIRLQKEERGTDKGIPTVILASATIDNLFSITCFYIVLATSLNSIDNGQLSYTIPRILVEVLIAGILGILAGLLIRSLPRKDASFLHFTRVAITVFMSLALYYGTRSIQCFIAGPIIVFFMCIVSAMKWKYDNTKRTKVEERAFRIMWILFFQPILFALIGLLFDFSVITWELFGNAMAIMFLGIIFRCIAAFLISLCTSLNIQEQGFMSMCFIPKATVQAALAPALAAYCLRRAETEPHANLVLQTCILSILITAPIGQLLILGLGRIMLFKRTVIADYNISNIGTNVSTYLQPNGNDRPKPVG